MFIYSSDPNFKSIRLDVECELGEYISIEDKRLPEWACSYADRILKCRWADIGKPEVEDIIGKHPEWAYMYARYVLKCKWINVGKPEIEDRISRDSYWAYWYMFLNAGGLI